MHKKLSILLFLLSSACLYGQDSTRVLSEVEIQAYRYNRAATMVPVSLGAIDQTKLQRFDNSSFLSAVNTQPGVRMEERSPGSYRFSIRGSLIRSPFGVRNIKFYWNSLPFTDGGGNTYLNLLDVSTIGNFEIIKGPGGSLYGANTGGVVLLKSRIPKSPGVEVGNQVGSYGLHRIYVRGDLVSKKSTLSINYSHHKSEGYRQQSAFKRDALNVDWSYAIANATVLTLTALTTDVFYETPGGLNKKEYDENPSQARPAAGPSKSAIEQNANVRNKGVYGGVTLAHDWGKQWVTDVGVYSSYYDFENYAIRNVEHRYETNIGGRLENQVTFGDPNLGGQASFGGELIYLSSPVNVFDNNSGTQGNQQVRDDLTSMQSLVFLQSEFFLPHEFFLTLGASSNFLKYNFDRSFPVADTREKSFNAVLTPRVALLKQLGKLSIFGSISKGFSPPTLAEVRPSTNAFNDELKPESGISYEVGTKAKVNQFTFDLSLYQFNLKETIVLQRLQDGAEVFTNSGETVQKGIELATSWKASEIFKVFATYNYNHYRFKDYKKFDAASGGEVDFSGNKMTGVPPTLFVLGLDFNFKNGVYANVTNSYTDHIPLNDANSQFAEQYYLLSTRVGYQTKWLNQFRFEVFFGGNNLLDEKYSLGNDLNAVNGRYYNAAARRNYFGGVKINFKGRKV